MASKPVYKTTFEVVNVIQPIYTGGSVALDSSGRILATCLGEDAVLTDLNTGEQLARIEGDGEEISTLTLTPSASHLIICSRSLSMRIYSVNSSSLSADTIQVDLLRTLKPHSTPVVVLAIDQTSTLLATGAADGVLKVWDIRGGYVTHTFRGPNVLISALHFFELAVGGVEPRRGISAQNVRQNFGRESENQNRGSGQPGEGALPGFRLASGSQDGRVRIWDLYKRKCTSTLDSHVSDVRVLDYSPEQNSLVTASRDKTVMWWDAQTWKCRKVITVLEEVEAGGFLKGGNVTYTGGQKGLRLWSTDHGRELTEDQAPGLETERIINVVSSKDLPFILAVRADQIMILYSLSSLESDYAGTRISPLPQFKRISGTHDEIIDLVYLLPDRSLLALATNSEELRIVSAEAPNTGGKIGKAEAVVETSYFGSDVTQLTGHGDIIICLDTDWSGHWVATGAKDNTARLWRIDPANSSYTCYATFTGHAESLGAISLPKIKPPVDSAAFKDPLNHPPSYLLTGSQDQTVKRWDIPRKIEQLKKASRAVYTRKAHEKDINAIDINANGQLFASASQDRTVKIWSIEEGEAQGILRGHRRGVWSVRFAPKDTPVIIGENGPVGGKGLIITGSGDKTLKIWNLSDYSCLRTFEGHTNSVLKVAWLNLPNVESQAKRHVQIVSAGGDGLVKVWDVNTGEIECTLDNHEDRVWALAVHPTSNTIVSGGADSKVTFWADISSTAAAAANAAAVQLVEQEQELQNYIHQGSYWDAITMALRLNHPARLLALFTTVISNNSEEGSLSGLVAVDKVLASLTDEQVFTLLLRVRDWNTNARTAAIAQRILWTLVKTYPASKFSNLRVKGATGERSLKEVLDALKAYTERHYRRMEELVDESYLVEYTLREMDDVAFAEDTGMASSKEPREFDQDMILI